MLRLLFLSDSEGVKFVLTDEVVFVIVKLSRPNPCFMFFATVIMFSSRTDG